MTEEQKPATILCVAYDEHVQRMLGRALDRIGYTVMYAGDSEEARPKISQSNLIISDITNGGFDLVTYVKANYQTVDVVLMDGGGHDQEKIERAKELGAFFIEKPFSPTGLVELVSRIIPQHLKPGKK